MSIRYAQVRALNNDVVVNLRSAAGNISAVTGLYHGWMLNGSDALDMINVGTREWERQTLKSVLAHGDIEVAARLGDPTLQLKLIHVAESDIEQRDDLEALIEAVSVPWIFYLQTWGGAIYAWRCKRADVTVPFSKVMLYGLSMQVNLSAPRHPIPVQGPI